MEQQIPLHTEHELLKPSLSTSPKTVSAPEVKDNVVTPKAVITNSAT